jgi:hypothetical protein
MDTSSSLPIGIVDVTRERADLKTADPRGKMALPDKLKYIRLSVVESGCRLVLRRRGCVRCWARSFE